MDQENSKLIYWRKWEEKFKYPKTGTFKYLLLHRKKNGFDKCIRIINKRIYLNIDETHNYFENCKEV